MYPLEVAPLRARRDDIPLLTGHFLDLAQERLGIEKLRLTPEARKQLLAHTWPGNVRELEHMLMRAAVRASEGRPGATIVIEPKHLGLEPSAVHEQLAAPASRKTSRKPLREEVDAFTRQLLETTIAESGNNWAEAARRLGLQRGNLHRLAARLGLRDQQP